MTSIAERLLNGGHDIRSEATSPGPFDDYWYTAIDAMGSGRVTPDAAMRVSAWYACMTVLTEDVASLPLILYAKQTAGGKERADAVPLSRTLRLTPNRLQTSFEWREMSQGHVMARGNAYSVKQPTIQGGIELVPLHPDRVKVSVTPQRIRVYKYRDPAGDERTFLDDEIFHLPGRDFDGVTGKSVMTSAIDALAVAASAQRSAVKMFDQGMKTPGVLQHPGPLTDEAYKRLREEFAEQNQGVANWHKPILLEDGMTWQSMSMTAQEAESSDRYKLALEDVARFFRMPQHKIGILDHATFCLPGDALVFTDGGPKPISEISAGEYVWSLATDGAWVTSRVERSEQTGEDEILTLRTSNRVVRMNARHRVLARRAVAAPATIGGRGFGDRHLTWGNEWVAAGDLRIGDVIVALGELPSEGSSMSPTRQVSPAFMEFCGYFSGNGNLMRNRGALAGIALARAQDAPAMSYYRDVLPSLFTQRGGRPIRTHEQGRATRFTSASAAREVDLLGLGGRAPTKAVPGWVFRLNAELRLSYLRGFLDSDGSVDKLGRISFSSSSRELLAGIRHLCMGLGVPVTNMRRAEGETRLPNGRMIAYVHYYVTCSDPAANLRIGTHTPEYARRLRAGRPFGRKGRAYPRFGGKGFERGALDLSRIVAIEHGPREAVYDLAVEGTHSFIADGVVVHNSNIEHMGIDYVVGTMRPWLVRWEQKIATDLINDPRLFAEFLVDALLRGDAKSRWEAYALARNIGVLNANEIRAPENMNALEGPEGEDRWRPLNMARATDPTPAQLAQQLAAQRSSQAQASGRAALFAESLAVRLVQREVDRVGAAAKRYAADGDGWATWLDEFYEGHAMDVAKAFHVDEAAGQAYAMRQVRELKNAGIACMELWPADRPAELVALALAS